MARGKSGRIVIEVEPDLKNELYESLARSGKHSRIGLLKQLKSIVKMTDNQSSFPPLFLMMKH